MKKFYVYPTHEERNLIIESLVAKKNEFTSAGKYTDDVDDVLLKIMQSKQKNVKLCSILASRPFVSANGKTLI